MSFAQRSAMVRNSLTRVSALRRRFSRSRRSRNAMAIAPVMVSPVNPANSPARRRVSSFLTFWPIANPGRRNTWLLPCAYWRMKAMLVRSRDFVQVFKPVGQSWMPVQISWRMVPLLIG